MSGLSKKEKLTEPYTVTMRKATAGVMESTPRKTKKKKRIEGLETQVERRGNYFGTFPEKEATDEFSGQRTGI